MNTGQRALNEGVGTAPRSLRALLRVASAVLLLAAVWPAQAIVLPDAAGGHRGGGGRGGSESTRAAAPTRPTATRDGFVQAIDAAAQSIVINSTRYVIGSPLLALLDKRPKTDGLLTLSGVKVGMYVRYRTEKTAGGDRVVELWVMRDPQKTGSPP